MGGSADLQRICAASPMVVLFLSILPLPLSKGARQGRREKQRMIEREGRRTGRTVGIKALNSLNPCYLLLASQTGICGNV